jgi:glycosyltransferase involved in cell wall biosynthesis
MRDGRAEHADPARIVYVIDSLETGGAERHLVRLVGGLLQSGEWHPSVYCLNRAGMFVQAMEEMGVEVAGPARHWSWTPAHFARSWWSLYRYMRRERPDIAHCYLVLGGMLGTLAARIAGVDHVISTRRGVYRFHGRQLWFYRVASAISDRCSDVVIAVSDAARQKAIEEGTPAAKLVTVRNSITPPVRSEQLERTLRGLPVFGTVGTLRAIKGHRFLLDAIPSVLEALPHARFVVVGDGPERARLEQQARTLDIAAHVDFLGHCDNVRNLVSQFDVFVLPSLSDAMPNAVLEAMAAGVPVVATRVDGVPEVIDDGISGVLVEAASSADLARALICLGRDDTVRRQFGDAAREIVTTRFNVRRELAETEAVYASLARSRRKRLPVHN